MRLTLMAHRGGKRFTRKFRDLGVSELILAGGPLSACTLTPTSEIGQLQELGSAGVSEELPRGVL